MLIITQSMFTTHNNSCIHKTGNFYKKPATQVRTPAHYDQCKEQPNLVMPSPSRSPIKPPARHGAQSDVLSTLWPTPSQGWDPVGYLGDF